MLPLAVLFLAIERQKFVAAALRISTFSYYSYLNSLVGYFDTFIFHHFVFCLIKYPATISV